MFYHYHHVSLQTYVYTFMQRWPNFFVVGPTLYKYYTNVLFMLD